MSVSGRPLFQKMYWRPQNGPGWPSFLRRGSVGGLAGGQRVLPAEKMRRKLGSLTVASKICVQEYLSPMRMQASKAPQACRQADSWLPL